MANPYYDANGVLYNKLGITDAAELKRVEYSMTSIRRDELLRGDVNLGVEGFGLDRLRAIHGHLFQDIFAWAGLPRETHSSKRAGNGMWTVFEAPERIGPAWKELQPKMDAFATAQGLTVQDKRSELAELYIEANRIHAFPEGNGRSTEVFMRLLAREQKMELDFSRTDKTEWNLAAAASGTHGMVHEGQLYPVPSDPRPIHKVFNAIARPELAYVFEKHTEAETVARFPELRQTFEQLHGIEAKARVQMGGDAERVEGYMGRVREAFVKLLDTGEPASRLHERAESAKQPQELGRTASPQPPEDRER